MSTNGTLKFYNPATGEEFGGVPMSSREEVTAAREQMRRASEIWRQKPVKERIRILKQFQKVLIDSTDEITAVMNRDCGKTRQDALIEVFITVDILHQYCKKADRWLKPERVPSGLYLFKRCYTEQRPYGTVAVIGPWNYPFVLVVPPMFAALLAGNTVLLKPSEVTAATGVLIEKLIQRVPELAPYVRVLHGDGAVGAALVESRPDLIFLTGSTETGRKVTAAAAENLTPVICELGGKDPMLVLEDADVKAAARWGSWGAFYNAGQTCMAVERVYVVEEVYDEFVRHALAETERIKMGYMPGTDSPYCLGPLTCDRQLRIVEEHLEDALARGAKILLGGGRDGLFVEPTVIVDVDHSMKLMREETFGPLMPIMRVKDEAEAIRLANDNAYGLGASVWSNDVARAERVAGRIEAGTVLVNDAMSHFAVPLLPFGGVKQSGSGRVHGKEDVLQFSQTHSYAISRPPFPLDIATVLRDPGHYKLGKGLLRLAFGVTAEQRLEPVAEELSANGRRGVRKGVATVGLLAGAAAIILGLVRRSERERCTRRP